MKTFTGQNIVLAEKMNHQEYAGRYVHDKPYPITDQPGYHTVQRFIEGGRQHKWLPKDEFNALYIVKSRT